MTSTRTEKITNAPLHASIEAATKGDAERQLPQNGELHKTSNEKKCAVDPGNIQGATRMERHTNGNHELKTSSSHRTSSSNENSIQNPFTIACALSTASAFGLIFGTLFMLVLPSECSRMGSGSARSVNLGLFIAIAGITQLICPLVGTASDTCDHPLGRRRPFLLLGSVASSVGFILMRICSVQQWWLGFGICFGVSMVAMNVLYSALIALIPDLIPGEQTGVANGIFALLLVVGALLGFSSFHYLLHENVQQAYVFYIGFLLATTALTLYVADETPLEEESTNEKDVESQALLARKSVRNTKDSLFGRTKYGAVANKSENPTASNAHYEFTRVGDASLLPANSPSAHHHKYDVSSAAYAAFLQIYKQGLSWAFLKSAYWLSPTEHHDFFFVTVSRTFYYMGVSVQTFLLYYVHDILNVSDVDAEGAVSLLSSVGFATGALTCYPVGLLSDSMSQGSRKPYVYGSCSILAAGCIALLFCRSFQVLIYLAALVGGANGAYLTMDTSLAVDTLPTRSDAAKFMGVWGVAGFVGSALGPMFGGPLLYWFGSSGSGVNMEGGDAGERQEYSIVGYAVVFSLSAVYFAMSALTLRWVGSRTLTNGMNGP